MQLTNTPGKLVLPFANAGAKNTIPTASQIGITAGAASLTDGFPPLTRTPIAAGGVPPSGLDMNGILYELSAILRWANAGGGYAYDAAFATDSNVNGYPKGARIMRSDGLGYWLNTVENNTTDPEAAEAAAAGWVPDFTNGVTSVAMASANVTLTPLQYGKPIIVITGTLTANLNLIFPAIVNEWTVINNTTGPYTITCKTAAGTGLVVNTAALIVGDGTNIQSAVTDSTASIVGASKNLVVKNNATTPASKLDVTAAEIVVKNVSGSAALVTSVAQTVDITVNGANGLDTGAAASNTWYYLWAIWNGTTKALLLSASSTAPTMPGGYTHKALISAVYRTTVFRDFVQNGNRVQAAEQWQTLSGGTSTSIVSVSAATFVPPIHKQITVSITQNTPAAVGQSVGSIYSGSSSTKLMGAVSPYSAGAAQGDTNNITFIPEISQTYYYNVTSGNSSHNIIDFEI